MHPTLEESNLDKTEGRRPNDRSFEKGRRAGNPKRQLPHCRTTAGPTAQTTPLLRDAQKPWGGYPLYGRPTDYLPPGTVGQWPPATGQWWTVLKGGDPKAGQAKKVTTRTPGWQPKETEAQRFRGRLGPQAGIPKRLRPNCHSCPRGTLEPAWVLHQGEGTQRPQRVKGKGPENLGVAAPLATAGCRGNCWRVVDGQIGKIDLRIFCVLALFVHDRYLQRWATRGNHSRRSCWS